VPETRGLDNQPIASSSGPDLKPLRRRASSKAARTGSGEVTVCVEITITISTTIPDVDEPAPDHVAVAGTTEPLKVCWTERLRNGETATHCVEVTVKLSAGPIS
jgi:hypothetical protein